MPNTPIQTKRRERFTTSSKARMFSLVCPFPGVLSVDDVKLMAEQADRVCNGQSDAGDHAGGCRALRRGDGDRTSATIPTRSTTCCAFPASFAARSPVALARSTKK